MRLGRILMGESEPKVQGQIEKWRRKPHETLIVFCISSLCLLAQDNAQAIPKPQERGQFFYVRDGKLTPLQEETDVSASSTMMYDVSIKIKKPESKVVLGSAEKPQFVVHLSDKSIGSHGL